MVICETARLRIRQLRGDDAAFIQVLTNDPDYVRNIGNRGVRTVDDAARYLRNGPMAAYEEWGFGLYLVEIKGNWLPIGTCGLLRRDYHPEVEIGFAFVPAGRGGGYAFEAASAVLEYAVGALQLRRIVAFTAPDNQPSIRLLTKLGFQFEKMLDLPGHDEPSRFFVRNTQE